MGLLRRVAILERCPLIAAIAAWGLCKSAKFPKVFRQVEQSSMLDGADESMQGYIWNSIVMVVFCPSDVRRRRVAPVNVRPLCQSMM